MQARAFGIVTLAVLVAAAVASGACNQQHSKVPSEAKPAGFKQLARWDSCGASGQYCSEVIIFGHNGISFEDASRDIEARYLEKHWSVQTFPEGVFDDGGLTITSRDGPTCVFVARFNLSKFRPYPDSPGAPEMAKLVEPYETVIEVSAGCG